MVTITKKRILKKNSVYVTIYTETLILIDLMQQNGKKKGIEREFAPFWWIVVQILISVSFHGTWIRRLIDEDTSLWFGRSFVGWMNEEKIVVKGFRRIFLAGQIRLFWLSGRYWILLMGRIRRLYYQPSDFRQKNGIGNHTLIFNCTPLMFLIFAFFMREKKRKLIIFL